MYGKDRKISSDFISRLGSTDRPPPHLALPHQGIEINARKSTPLGKEADSSPLFKTGTENQDHVRFGQAFRKNLLALLLSVCMRVRNLVGTWLSCFAIFFNWLYVFSKRDHSLSRFSRTRLTSWQLSWTIMIQLNEVETAGRKKRKKVSMKMEFEGEKEEGVGW